MTTIAQYMYFNTAFYDFLQPTADLSKPITIIFDLEPKMLLKGNFTNLIILQI